MVEEDEAFLVGNGGEGVVGVFAFEVDYELCEFVVGTELFDIVGKGFPTDDSGKGAVRFAVAVSSLAKLNSKRGQCIHGGLYLKRD